MFWKIKFDSCWGIFLVVVQVAEIEWITLLGPGSLERVSSLEFTPTKVTGGYHGIVLVFMLAKLDVQNPLCNLFSLG